MIQGYKDLSYEEKLERCGLTTLEKRRSRGDLGVGMIRRTIIVTRDKDTILRLYKTLVRPQLEYCIQVWNPHIKQDMEKLEKVH